MKVVIVPGNGGGDVCYANWYGWVQRKCNQLENITCDLRNMPDPELARESFWIPFMKDELRCDKETIIIGHSSGAEASMRYAEQYCIKGIILVSACVTDLGMESEKVSGYYDRPWKWDQIKANTEFLVQFGSMDDPFIPWGEQEQVHNGLGSELHKFEDRGHFMNSTFPELVKVVVDKISK